MRDRMMRDGITLVEIMLVALLLSVCAVPILELIRTGTGTVGLSELDLLAQNLASDALEVATAEPQGMSLSSRRNPGVRQPLLLSRNRTLPCDVFVENEPVVGKGFPLATFRATMERARMRITVSPRAVVPVPGLSERCFAYRDQVTVTWVDAQGRDHAVTLAKLH